MSAVGPEEPFRTRVSLFAYSSRDIHFRFEPSSSSVHALRLSNILVRTHPSRLAAYAVLKSPRGTVVSGVRPCRRATAHSPQAHPYSMRPPRVAGASNPLSLHRSPSGTRPIRANDMRSDLKYSTNANNTAGRRSPAYCDMHDHSASSNSSLESLVLLGPGQERRNLSYIDMHGSGMSSTSSLESLVPLDPTSRLERLSRGARSAVKVRMRCSIFAGTRRADRLRSAAPFHACASSRQTSASKQPRGLPLSQRGALTAAR
jgi:hypothetical protein